MSLLSIPPPPPKSQPITITINVPPRFVATLLSMLMEVVMRIAVRMLL